MTRNKLFDAPLMIMALACCTFLAAACTSRIEDIRYEGDAFIQFSDSDYVMPVTEKDVVFEVPVGVTAAAPYDRTVAVSVDVRNSNALEGYHFTIENNNVTIPAGRLSGTLRMHGLYDNIDSVDDSLTVTLRLLTSEQNISPIYKDAARVRIQKVRPFRIDDYVGDLQMTCTFPFSTSSVTQFYVKSVKVNDSTLLVKKPFDSTHDLTLRFHSDAANPLDQSISMVEQIAFTDNDFGQVAMRTVDGVPSYYLPENRAFVLYLEAYLVRLGTFGSYFYVFEWVTPDKVIANDNGLSTLY